MHTQVLFASMVLYGACWFLVFFFLIHQLMSYIIPYFFERTDKVVKCIPLQTARYDKSGNIFIANELSIILLAI